MHRRTFLEASVATVGGSLAVGAVSGQESNGFEPLGSVDVDGATETVFHPSDDSIVYVAASDGLATVDISGGEPELHSVDRNLETRDGDQMGLLWDLWTWEDRLILAGPAENLSQYATGFVLYDTSDPANPERLTTYSADVGSIHNTSFDDGIVYLTGSGLDDQPLVMVDVTADDPTELGRFSIVDHDPAWREVGTSLRALHDVHVHDGIAYLSQWDAGAWLVDVSDPESPTVLSRTDEFSPDDLQSLEYGESYTETFGPPGNTHVTTVDEGATVMAVGEEAWEVETENGLEGGAGGVRLYDITDKANPQRLARIEPPESAGQTQSDQFTTAHNLDIGGDRLYTSWYFGGVKIHDISDPADPEELAWWRKPSVAVFWAAQAADDVFVATSVDIQDKLGVDIGTRRDALYVFPDEAGEQVNPPSLTEPDSTTSGEDGSTKSDEASTNSGTEETDDSEDETNADDSGPGFGIAAGLLGAGGYALARRQRGEE